MAVITMRLSFKLLLLTGFAFSASCRTAGPQEYGSGPAAGARAAATPQVGQAASPSGAALTGTLPPIRGLWLNDVSVLLPFSLDSEFVGRALWAHDHPDPARYAPGQPALALENDAFLPDWALTNLDRQIALDAKAAGIVTAGVGQRGLKPLLEEGFFTHQDDFINVGMRLLPCVNELDPPSDPAACEREMRLVWQPINWNDTSLNGMRIIEQSIQTVYSLTAAEFAAIVATLQSLQEQSGLDYSHEPLEEHPVLIAQGINGTYFAGFIGIIHRYARVSRLTSVRAFGNTSISSGGIVTWPMTEFTVVQGKPQIPTAIPCLALPKKSPERYVQRLFPPLGHPGNTDPPPASSDSWLAALPSTPKAAALAALAPSLQTKLAVVENPGRHLTSTLDCATCHLAQSVRSELGNLAVPLGQVQEFHVDGWNATNKTAPAAAQQGIQMFGFSSRTGTAVTAQRTINESIAAAIFINSGRLGKP